jgi:hypothetical protein
MCWPAARKNLSAASLPAYINSNTQFAQRHIVDVVKTDGHGEELDHVLAEPDSGTHRRQVRRVGAWLGQRSDQSFRPCDECSQP